MTIKKKKTTWIGLAVIVNALLLAFNLGAPREAAAGSSRMYHCCKESSKGGEYCCERCCWIAWGCGDKETCGDA